MTSSNFQVLPVTPLDSENRRGQTSQGNLTRNQTDSRPASCGQSSGQSTVSFLPCSTRYILNLTSTASYSNTTQPRADRRAKWAEPGRPDVPDTEKAETGDAAKPRLAGFGLTVQRQFIRRQKHQKTLRVWTTEVIPTLCLKTQKAHSKERRRGLREKTRKRGGGWQTVQQRDKTQEDILSDRQEGLSMEKW